MNQPCWLKLTPEECRQRILADPKDLEARLVMGMTYRLCGDHRAAIEMWMSILEINPSHDPAKQLLRSLEKELDKGLIHLQ